MKWKVNPRVTKGIVVALCVGAAAVGRGGSGGAPAAAAAKLPPLKLIELAGKDPNGPQFRDALVATLGEDRIKSGRAVTGEGPDFLWAIETSALPQLIIDDAVGPAMAQIQGMVAFYPNLVQVRATDQPADATNAADRAEVDEAVLHTRAHLHLIRDQLLVALSASGVR